MLTGLCGSWFIQAIVPQSWITAVPEEASWRGRNDLKKTQTSAAAHTHPTLEKLLTILEVATYSDESNQAMSAAPHLSGNDVLAGTRGHAGGKETSKCF